uniref:Gnk2-homologous domain-containing protein n=1 Tax=Oryza nivara TaxID=4536 RepID=A0A0E0I1P1_ORYNI
MTRAAIILLVLVLALVAPPLAAAAAATDAVDDDGGGHRPPIHLCGGVVQGRFARNSSYEANLRHVAATLPAMVANGSSPSNRSSCVSILAGVRPDQISASAFCCNSSAPAYSDCGACVAMAFRYARWLCRYRRRAMVDLGACRVGYHDVERMEREMRAVSAVRRMGRRYKEKSPGQSAAIGGGSILVMSDG